jgi:hypothetical protein
VQTSEEVEKMSACSRHCSAIGVFVILFAMLLCFVPSGAQVSEEMNFYFGNLHSHTGQYSKESNRPKEVTYDDAFNYAASDGQLDFMAVTIHNHLSEPEAYPELLKAAKKHTKAGKFVALAGQEYNKLSQGNHINVFEADAWIEEDDVPCGDFKTLYEEWMPVHKTSFTFIQFNHPATGNFGARKKDKKKMEYGLGNYDGDMKALQKACRKWARAIEIINASAHSEAETFSHWNIDQKRLNAYLFALSKGWYLGPTANQDNHRLNYGSSSECRTVACAPSLTKEAIVRAFQHRRFYASEDQNLKVTFRMGSYWMGSIVPFDKKGRLTVKVEDEDEPGLEYIAQLYAKKIGQAPIDEDSPVEEVTLKGGETRTIDAPNPQRGMYYVLKVTQVGTEDDPGVCGSEDHAWTAPIWIGSTIPK